MAYNTYNNRNNNYSKNNKTFNEQELELKFKEKGFTDVDGYLREELITSEALKIAESFASNNLSNSQLRAFFNEVKAINNKLDDKKEKFNEVYPMILMLKSKIEYRASKEEKKMKNFKLFLTEAVNYIQKQNKIGKGYETFKNFIIFFEAIVGYSYGVGINK